MCWPGCGVQLEVLCGNWVEVVSWLSSPDDEDDVKSIFFLISCCFLKWWLILTFLSELWKSVNVSLSWGDLGVRQKDKTRFNISVSEGESLYSGEVVYIYWLVSGGFSMSGWPCLLICMRRFFHYTIRFFIRLYI